MAALTDIYDVTATCYRDEDGVYIDGEKVALNNKMNNGYIRRNGPRSFDNQTGCSGYIDSSLPLRFVGAVPGGKIDEVERATIAALISSVNVIQSSETDKAVIAEEEGIPLEELKKFDDVVLIAVDYLLEEKKFYDPNCDYDLC